MVSLEFAILTEALSTRLNTASHENQEGATITGLHRTEWYVMR